MKGHIIKDYFVFPLQVNMVVTEGAGSLSMLRECFSPLL